MYLEIKEYTMGLIISISKIFTRLFNKKPVKILMLGLYGAGKTTILYKIKLNQVVETIPTIGFNVEIVEHKNISFTVFDVAGHTRAWRFYFADTIGIIFVINSTDRMYITEAKQQLHDLLNEEQLENSVLLVFANKQDLSNPMSTSELTEIFELNTIKNRKWFIQATSAVTGEGLYEGLDWLSNELATR